MILGGLAGPLERGGSGCCKSGTIVGTRTNLCFCHDGLVDCYHKGSVVSFDWWARSIAHLAALANWPLDSRQGSGVRSFVLMTNLRFVWASIWTG